MWIWISSTFLLLLHVDQCVLSNLFYNDQQLHEGSRCQLRNGGEGICVKASECEERTEQIYREDIAISVIGRCGFDNFDEIFCCTKKLHMRFRKGIRPAEAACENHKQIFKDMDADGDVRASVINGVFARAGEFPHMVALGYSVPEEEAVGGVKYACGGTLISGKHILTAAHCVDNVHQLIPREVLLGTNDLDVTGAAKVQRIPISKIIKHPDYKRSLNYHDLAILELDYPVEFTIDVRPTCLMTKPLTRSIVNERTSLVILGWGAADLAETASAKLLKADSLKFVNKKRCCKRYADLKANIPHGLDDAMLCVKDPNTGRRADTCWGDNGGPLLISSSEFPLLIGVNSFGRACGGNAPGVYVSVYKYLDWIEDQVWPNFD